MDLDVMQGQVLLPEIKTLHSQPIVIIFTDRIFIGLHFDLAIAFWVFLQNFCYIWWYTWKRPLIHICKSCNNWWKQNLASTCIGTYGDNLVTEDFKISFPVLGHIGQRDAPCSTNVAASVPSGIAVAVLEISNWRTWHKLGRQAPSQCCQVTFSLPPASELPCIRNY